MLNTKERKLERAMSGLPDTLSPNMYNAAIGGCLLYGLLLNALIVVMFGDALAGVNGVGFTIVYFILCIAGTLCAASSSPGMSFLGYNLIALPVGAVVAVNLPYYATSTVSTAVFLTAAVVTVMLTLSAIWPQLFAGMGRALGTSLSVTLIISLVSGLLGFQPEVYTWIFVAIFSLYIGYDWDKAQAYPKTLDNAIDSALDLYLDIINLFLRILRIVARAKSDD